MSVSVFLVSLFTFVELNCENLFDCRHDSLKQDMEFTPDGDRRWTPQKYWNKIDNTVKAVMAAGEHDGEWQLPDMVALCEIENDSVAHDLARRSMLRTLGYEYAITDSPDVRGIDVALFWHPGSFQMISKSSLRVKPLRNMRPTRDILYVSGLVHGGDTLHVFVVHAPSRYGGRKRTEPHRMAVVKRLSQTVDSLRAAVANPKIIIAGDFNDYADSQPLSLLAGCGMLNVSAKAVGSNGAKASYKYKGLWRGIDHILVSHEMMPWVESCKVCDALFLLEEDIRYGGVKPFRTSNGYRYQNGYSDHLPLTLRVGIP